MWTSQINNTNFKSALEQSLQYANLYHQFAGAKYSLDANIVRVKQPLFGFDTTVTCEVHYLLKNAQTNIKFYDDTIITSYTATVNDTFDGVTRLKIANEGAMKANIQKLIEILYQLPKR